MMHRIFRQCSRFGTSSFSCSHIQQVRNFAAAASQQLAAIKALRDKSGAPISDVKSALVETGWDMDSAFNALRKKGLAAATKKASRHAAEGLVGVSRNATSTTIVEVNCETDFVSRNPSFISLVERIAAAAGKTKGTACKILDVERVKEAQMDDGRSVSDSLLDLAGSMRENMQVRRAMRLRLEEDGVLGSYIHNTAAEGVGKIAGAVALDIDTEKLSPEGMEKAQDVCNKLAMHVVAAKPGFLDKSTVSEDALEAERSILRDQARASGKPENIINKMVEGRLSKFYEEQCLLQQKYVMDDSIKIEDVVKQLASSVGTDARISGFVRMQCGEGLDKPVGKDFASEVAETIQSLSSSSVNLPYSLLHCVETMK